MRCTTEAIQFRFHISDRITKSIQIGFHIAHAPLCRVILILTYAGGVCVSLCFEFENMDPRVREIYSLMQKRDEAYCALYCTYPWGTFPSDYKQRIGLAFVNREKIVVDKINVLPAYLREAYFVKGINMFLFNPRAYGHEGELKGIVLYATRRNGNKWMRKC